MTRDTSHDLRNMALTGTEELTRESLTEPQTYEPFDLDNFQVFQTSPPVAFTFGHQAGLTSMLNVAFWSPILQIGQNAPSDNAVFMVDLMSMRLRPDERGANQIMNIETLFLTGRVIECDTRVAICKTGPENQGAVTPSFFRANISPYFAQVRYGVQPFISRYGSPLFPCTSRSHTLSSHTLYGGL